MIAVCTHPRANHQHGHYVTYKRDRCRCVPCSTAARRYEKAAAYRRVSGRSNYVDPGPAREHLITLLGSLTIGQIEGRTGINRMAVYAILGRANRKPSRRITRRTEQLILAVVPNLVGIETRGLVDYTGTRRRLLALMAIGWPKAELVRRLGWSSRTLWSIVTAPGPIKVRTREQAAALYDELWSTPPAPSRAVTATVELARVNGWAPPMAWDDDTIDDPNAVADFGGDGPSSLLDQVLDLVDIQPGITLLGAAHRLHRAPETIEQALHRGGRRDLIARLRGSTGRSEAA